MKVLAKALTRLHLPLQSCLCPQPGKTLGKQLSRFFRLHKAEPEREREGEVVIETKKKKKREVGSQENNWERGPAGTQRGGGGEQEVDETDKQGMGGQ